MSQRIRPSDCQALPVAAVAATSTSPIARDALGLGLRVPHYAYLFEHWPELDYLEVITENFLSPAAQPLQNLARVSARYPVVLHGVGLNLLGHAPLDQRYLDDVRRLADRVDAAFISDHLCWTGSHGIQHHDLLPMPYTAPLVEYAAERAYAVQKHLGRPFGLENLSSYVEFRESTMSEAEFYSQVVRTSGCHFMLDINNVYVSAVNHDFDPYQYLCAIDFARVLQAHLAGHTRNPNGTIVDTHDQPVCREVWDLYKRAWELGGPFPTLLEWDANIPSMPVALTELQHARQVRA